MIACEQALYLGLTRDLFWVRAARGLGYRLYRGLVSSATQANVDIMKTNRNVVYRGLYSYRQRVRVTKHFFFVLFPHIERVSLRTGSRLGWV